MAILIPFTFSMDPLSALLMLASISVGAAFGGSITSILLNIPGEASSAATAYDGYPMAQQGKAKVAMGLSAGASLAAAIVVKTVEALTHNLVVHGDRDRHYELDVYVEEIVRLVATYLTTA